MFDVVEKKDEKNTGIFADVSLSYNMMRAMKYLSADLLPKVFHGLICVTYQTYTFNSYCSSKQAVFFFVTTYSLIITEHSIKQQ